MPRLCLAVVVAAAVLAAPQAFPSAADPVSDRYAEAAAALERDCRSPEGIADLAALAALVDELTDLGRLAAVYERIADDPSNHPEVRSLARYQLVELERSRGNLARSQTLLRKLGFVTGWTVIGPFDDEGKRGPATAYPPEQGVDLSARYPGKIGEVGWRPLPRDAEGVGFVNLGAALRPDHAVAAYALAVVVAPRDERVRLWFGGSGAAKVWLNGVLAVEDPTYHAARLDQRGVAVTLRKGPNRLLVKLCHQDGTMGFYLRLCDDCGEGRMYTAGDPAAPPPPPGQAPVVLDDAAIVLARRATEAGGRNSPQAHAALSAVLAARAAGDREDRRAAFEASQAAALAPHSVDLQLAAAALEEERSARRSILDVALREAPGDARVIRAVAGDELEQGRPQAAARLLERAVAAAPGWPELRVALAEALDPIRPVRPRRLDGRGDRDPLFHLALRGTCCCACRGSAGADG